MGMFPLGFKKWEMKVASNGWLHVLLAGIWVPVFLLSEEQQKLWTVLTEKDDPYGT